VSIDEEDIKNYVNDHLSGISGQEKEKILNSISYGLEDEFKIKLKLTTSSNG
jgi:hypothetical protein